ncbi:MAG: ABC-2 type transport system permease protein [Planctomycetota bacterium]|jgi:ABC-2 type transport system permease protein
MNKIFAIARAEFLQAVTSKAFLIGLFVMPLLMGGGLVFQVMVADRVDLSERACAVYDPSGELWPVLEAAAEQRNTLGIWEMTDEGERKQRRPEFTLTRFVPEGDERPDVALSQGVRDGELHGFVLLDETLLTEELSERPFAYHTDEPTFTELPSWIEQVVNDTIRRRRFQEAGMDSDLAAKLSSKVRLRTWGLTETRTDGTVDDAEEENKLVTFGIPFAGMMLLFMLVMTTAPQLMNQVLEEKMQRISEVLVSSVTPFQLMLGKLLGSVGVSMTLATIYLGGVMWATHHWNVSHMIPMATYGWFLLMMVFALLMYGSLFGALGSACTELRDAQSMMMPAMIILMIPMFALGAIIESPNGPLATGLTYFPTATPMIFLLRVLAPPGPATWEIFAAVGLCIVTTVVLVWSSGKIFRVGVLSQGQAPSFKNLFKWIFMK